MKISVDGFAFDFTDAQDLFVFDEQDRNKPRFHGLSHAMKAVDLIVELPRDFLFVEVKYLFDPLQYKQGECFQHLTDVLKHKYRDTFLYRWSEKCRTKTLRYMCLLNLDTPLLNYLPGPGIDFIYLNINLILLFVAFIHELSTIWQLVNDQCLSGLKLSTPAEHHHDQGQRKDNETHRPNLFRR